MTPPQPVQLSLVRARTESLVGYIRSGRMQPPASRRTGEPAILLASATVILALVLVLVRGATVTAPDVRYIGAPKVSLRAWTLSPPAPTAAPVAVVPAPPPLPPALLFASSPLTREEGIKVVLARARSLIGHPYRYGASGPDAFDCSGFTSYVWRAAGIELPHSSGAQYSSLPRVSTNSLQPGDLLFSGSGGVGHVGLYIGGGQMIDSPETGRRVEIEGLRDNLIGAARPALLLRPSQTS
jgi:cell wall-associated NlpC family hydrolase